MLEGERDEEVLLSEWTCLSKMKGVLDMDDDDGYTTMCIYQMPLNWILKSS